MMVIGDGDSDWEQSFHHQSLFPISHFPFLNSIDPVVVLRRTLKFFYLSILGVCNHKISIFPSTTGLTPPYLCDIQWLHKESVR
jgi:hypothetical protein